MRAHRVRKGQQRWTNKKLAPWAYTALGLSVVQHIFRLDVMGKGFTYHLVVDLIPLFIGLLVLAMFRWTYLVRRSTVTKGMVWKAGLWTFMLIQGILFSYCSFGLVARATVDQLNRGLDRNEPMEIEEHAITEAWMLRRKSRYFAFERHGRRERIYTSYIKELGGQRWNPPYNVVLHTRAGILGTTIVVEYSLVPQENTGEKE